MGLASKREPLISFLAQRERRTRECTQQGHGQQCRRRSRTYRPRFKTNLKGFSLRFKCRKLPYSC